MDKPYDWNPEKNRTLLQERDVSFDDVINAIDDGKVVEDAPHPNKINHPNQRMMTVIINNYCYLIPYVEDNEKIFLKTIIPSRKATKKHLIDKKEK